MEKNNNKKKNKQKISVGWFLLVKSKMGGSARLGELEASVSQGNGIVGFAWRKCFKGCVRSWLRAVRMKICAFRNGESELRAEVVLKCGKSLSGW